MTMKKITIYTTYLGIEILKYCEDWQIYLRIDRVSAGFLTLMWESRCSRVAVVGMKNNKAFLAGQSASSCQNQTCANF